MGNAAVPPCPISRGLSLLHPPSGSAGLPSTSHTFSGLNPSELPLGPACPGSRAVLARQVFPERQIKKER